MKKYPFEFELYIKYEIVEKRGEIYVLRDIVEEEGEE